MLVDIERGVRVDLGEAFLVQKRGQCGHERAAQKKKKKSSPK